MKDHRYGELPAVGKRVKVSEAGHRRFGPTRRRRVIHGEIIGHDPQRQSRFHPRVKVKIRWDNGQVESLWSPHIEVIE